MSGSSRIAGTTLDTIRSQPYPGELPAGWRGEEIPIACANVRLRGGAGAAAQNPLVAHEFAVVLAQRPYCRAEAGIGNVGARCPFPNITKDLSQGKCGFGALRRLRMKYAFFDEVSFCRKSGGCMLPF